MQGAAIRLTIDAQRTRVEAPQPGGIRREWQLAIGAAHPGVAFRRHPPTALELEEAIAAVEDAVMPLVRQLPPGLPLRRPAGASTLPQDPAFDGWLLVLREFMHHGAFGRLGIEAP